MDASTLHLLAKLDDMRETQLSHGQRLEEIAARLAALLSGSPPTTSRASWPRIAASGAQWTGAAAALAIVASGGDIGSALALLQKLF